MPAELDHLFVMVSRGAPEAHCLVEVGIREARPNRHPGQGTACRRFFFDNAYLELLWVENPEEAQSEAVQPLGLWERWSNRHSGACPFGVVLRPSGPGGQGPPFPAWEYRPGYLPPTLTLHIGGNSRLVEEPLLVYLPARRRPDSLPAPERPPLRHAPGFQQLTALRLFGTWQDVPSAVMQAAERSKALTLFHAQEYFAEIGFSKERQRRHFDLRPILPLVLCI
jgi:hypothetical protein